MACRGSGVRVPSAPLETDQGGSMPTKKSNAEKPEVAATRGRESSGSGVGTAGGGAVYGLGLIGAAVYYIQESTGFGEFLVACLKALVWPAFVVYDLLKH